MKAGDKVLAGGRVASVAAVYVCGNYLGLKFDDNPFMVIFKASEVQLIQEPAVQHIPTTWAKCLWRPQC